MNMDPFVDSMTLAAWSADMLEQKGIDEIARWRMIEYWFQVELFRAIQAGKAGLWSHIGDYEHPYHTEKPRQGSKTKTKWVDLVLAQPKLDSPNSIVWIELKDLGRSKATAINNAAGLGRDLAALWALDVEQTRKIWIDPLPHSFDRGRLEEWQQYGPKLTRASHRIAQIVLCHKSLCSSVSSKMIQQRWIQSFHSRLAGSDPKVSFEIAEAETDQFLVLALVQDLE
ncbi:MAG: hypothetical protein U5P41_12925 [Gammaproteobacteria bacterium]|nr:hypothetical protein [Gammaproteobacteria bacterium]